MARRCLVSQSHDDVRYLRYGCRVGHNFSEIVRLTSVLLLKAACKIGRALFFPLRHCLW